MGLSRVLVIDVINSLITTRNQIFDQLVNIGFQTEFIDLKDTFQNGDVYTFELAHFEDSKDINLQKLVELCKSIEGTIYSMMNINGIDEDEVNL